MAEKGDGGFLLALLVLLLGSSAIRTCDGVKLPIPLRRYHVRVENSIPDKPLDVHCKSRDDDLGLHVLAPGDHVAWSFRVNSLGSTLYFCNVRCAFGHRSFDAFKVEPDLIFYYCLDRTCQWKADEKGIHLFRAKSGQWVRWYTWDKNLRLVNTTKY